MAVLPEGLPNGITLQTMITPQRQPSKTWKINKKTNQIEGEVDGYEAVKQAVEIILNTERYRWQIYQPYSGVEWDIGRSPEYVTARLLKRVTDALTVDDRVISVTDFTFSINGDSLTAQMTVNTVYGEIASTVEVNIA